MEWVLGVDASFDILTAEKARALKQAGVRVFMQCLWTGNQQPAPRVINLRVAHEEGILIGGYISVSSSRAGDEHVDMARSGVPNDLWNALIRAPVDVELPNLNLNHHIYRALDKVAALGKPQDIYTNWNSWVNLMGNPVIRPGVGLWNAYWDNQPDIDFPRLPFGGWKVEQVWGEQYSGEVNFGGLHCDLNAFAIETAPPPADPTEPWDVVAVGVGIKVRDQNGHESLIEKHVWP